MASNYFEFSPLSGSGNGSVRVWPKASAGTNTSHSDRVATLTITNGTVTRNVTIRQYGIPTMTLVSGQNTNVPATGGTISYTIYTRYPFGFQNIPDWITISDSNGRYYNETSTYPATYATGATFYITVSANSRTDTGRATADYATAFRFKTTESGSWDSNITYININQAAAEPEVEDYINVTPISASFDWNTDGYHQVVINVDASGSNWTFNNTANGYFDAVKNGNTLTITTKSNNTSTTIRTGAINFAIGNATASVSLTQYRQPRIAINSGSDQYPVPMAGGTRYVNVTSDYNWWFLPLPIEEYITITDYQNNVQSLSYADPHFPINTNNTFNFTFARNETEAIRSCYFYLGWIGLDGESYFNSRNTVSFSQLDTTEPVHNIDLPDALTVSNIGGTNRAVVSSDDDWWFIDVPAWISITDENGNSVVVNDPLGQQDADNGMPHTYYLHWESYGGDETRSYRPTIEYAGGTAQSISTYTQYGYVIPPYINCGGYLLPYMRTVKEIMVRSDYDWYWSDIPSYVTIFDENNQYANYTSSNPNTTDKGTGMKTYYWIFDENTTGGRSCRPQINYGTYTGSSFVEVGSVSDISLYQMGPYEIMPTSGSDAMPYATAASFTFSLAGTPWTYTAPSWMVVTADTDSHYGNFYMNIAENTGIQRVGDVSVTSNGRTLYYTFTQGGAIALGPEPNDWHLEATDTTNHTVIVRMLEPWNHRSNNDWIKINNYDHSAGGMGTLVFYLEENTSSDSRNGTITVYDSENSYEIYIEQLGGEEEDVFSISKTSLSVSASSTTTTLETTITATGGYTATTTYSWIHFVAGSTASNSNPTTLYFYCDNYSDTTANRNGTITVTRADGTVRTISVRQYMAWSFSSSESGTNLSFKKDGSKYGSWSFPTYEANYPFKLLDSNGNTVSWIYTGTFPAGSGTLDISVGTNDTGSVRQATVNVWQYNPQTGQYNRQWSDNWTIIQFRA